MSMGTWYSHPGTRVLMCTGPLPESSSNRKGYMERGWVR